MAIISCLNRIWLRVYGETVDPLFFQGLPAATPFLTTLSPSFGRRVALPAPTRSVQLPAHPRYRETISPSASCLSSILITLLFYSHTIVAILNSLALKPNACPSRC